MVVGNVLKPILFNLKSLPVSLDQFAIIKISFSVLLPHPVIMADSLVSCTV